MTVFFLPHIALMLTQNAGGVNGQDLQANACQIRQLFLNTILFGI